MLDKQYEDYDRDTFIDYIQIKNICQLYQSNESDHSENLSDMVFSSPEFSSSVANNTGNVLTSKEFIKKYTFFVKTLYAFLKIEVDVFHTKNNILIFKNNADICKSLLDKKKKLINEQIHILKNISKTLDSKFPSDYEDDVHNFNTKMKIIDKLLASMNKLISNKIISKKDSLLTLILPYFYKYNKIIEEYC